MIRAGVERGEFDTDDPSRIADQLIALTDGMGVRVLLEDPAMSLERARRLTAEALAPELGVDADALTGSAGRV